MSALTIASYRDWKRLADLIGRLGPEHESERSAAASMADRHLRDVLGWTWAQFIKRATRLAPIVRRPRPRRPVGEPFAQLRYVLAYWRFLSPWKRKFASSLEAQAYPVTGPEREKRAQVAERLAQCCGRAAEDVA